MSELTGASGVLEHEQSLKIRMSIAITPRRQLLDELDEGICLVRHCPHCQAANLFEQVRDRQARLEREAKAHQIDEVSDDGAPSAVDTPRHG